MQDLNRRVVLTRYMHTKDATYGDLHVYNDWRHIFYCSILELPWRGNLKRVSRIPAGTYVIKLEWSEKFQSYLWEIKAVPHRSECKFHQANFVKQINGCMAFARSFKDIDSDGIKDATYSRDTMEKFHKMMEPATEAMLTIIDLY